jgi:hypothetical protein
LYQQIQPQREREREREREKTFFFSVAGDKTGRRRNAGEGWPVVGGRSPREKPLRGTGTTGDELAGDRLREGGGFDGGELR